VYPERQEGDLVVRDFRFASGETLPEVRLHWVTLGAPRRDGQGRIANAVLLLHGSHGTSRQWFEPGLGPELFGPGQPLDPARWYVILPDGLGRGGSTKPSDGLRARFPRYGYRDVVAAQHLVVTEGLAVDRLRAIVGTSMGGMHAWMWAARWPGLVDAILPLACQPRAISGRNLLFRRVLVETIRNDPAWSGGDYRTPPPGFLSVAPLWKVILDDAVHLEAEAPTREAGLAVYARLADEARTTWDANDFLYWIESSWDYDPRPSLGAIRARVVAVNFAGDLLNPAELAATEALVRSVPGARFVLVPETEGTRGHLSMKAAALWKGYLSALLEPGAATEGG
jgi:homoserine O-acetyltransferase